MKNEEVRRVERWEREEEREGRYKGRYRAAERTRRKRGRRRSGRGRISRKKAEADDGEITRSQSDRQVTYCK